MKNWKRFLSLLLAGLMMVGLLAGCGGGQGEQPSQSPSTSPSESLQPSETPSAEPALESKFDGKNLTVCVASEPQTMDPALSSTVDGAIMFSHLFEGLLKRVDNGSGEAVNAKLVGGMAETWDKVVADNGETTYTFHLRDGIKWSDGKPLTAGDFVYTWQRLANPATGADYCYQLDMVKGYAQVQDADKPADPTTLAVSAPDDKTFVVTLTYDCPYFEDIAAFPATYPVRQDVIEKNGDQWCTSDHIDEYISNGPFKLAEWVNNSYIKLVPNENYYGDGTSLETLTFALSDDDNAQLAAFKSGDWQFIENLPIGEIPGLLADGTLKINPYLGTYFVCFETTKAPFDNADVRKAFSLAIDRNFIVENVTQTGETPADAYVSPGIYDAGGPGSPDFHSSGNAPYWSTAPADYEANCAEANRLLDEAGYTDRSTFPVVTYIFNTMDSHQKIAEALQNMWETQLGVKVQLSNMDWNAFVDARKKGEYSVARHGWIADYNDPMSYIDMWKTGGGNNDAHWSNSEYDKLVDAAKATAVPEERMKFMHQAEDLLMQEQPIAPLYFYTNKYMLDPAVKGMIYDPEGFFIFTYCTKA